MENNNHNSKQDISIAELKKDVSWIITELTCVKHQVSNDIPHQIEKLETKVDNITSKLVIGLLVFIASSLILQMILKLF